MRTREIACIFPLRSIYLKDKERRKEDGGEEEEEKVQPKEKVEPLSLGESCIHISLSD